MDFSLFKSLIIKQKMEQTFVMKDDKVCLTNYLILKRRTITTNFHQQLESYMKYLESRIEFLFKYYFEKKHVLYISVKPEQLRIGEEIMEIYSKLISNNTNIHCNDRDQLISSDKDIKYSSEKVN